LFKDEAALNGVDSTRDGRGIGVADFDNDGRLDLFVANANNEPYLYHNVGPTDRHWAQLDLTGTKSNRLATGAQVRLTAGGHTYLRFVDGGNGFAGQSMHRLHFGLGATAKIDRAEVRWPSGLTEVFTDLPVDRLTHITEGSSKR
jgi:enediyne biosynthesis protein E4